MKVEWIYDEEDVVSLLQRVVPEFREDLPAEIENLEKRRDKKTNVAAMF